MKGSFKTALIAAVVSAVVSASAAVATTSNFILGSTTANMADAATAVTAKNVSLGGLNAKMLQLTNNSTGSSATALGLTTANSRPPMIVSSGAKVANLNADKLDGLDSSAFQRRVTGTCSAGSAIGSVGSGGTVTCNRESVRPGITGSISLTFNPHQCAVLNLSVAGTVVGDSGIVAPDGAAWPAGLIFQVLRANQAGHLPIEACNPTDAAVSASNVTISIWIVKLTP